MGASSSPMMMRASAVGLTTIRRAELTESETSLTAANNLAIRRALEAAGVEFIDENGGGPGVRLCQRSTENHGSESVGRQRERERERESSCRTMRSVKINLAVPRSALPRSHDAPGEPR
jgi:hypothetical protein